MRKLILLLSCSSYISCSSLQDRNIYGHYVQTIAHTGQREIILEKNSFDYTADIPLALYKSKGIWTINKNKLLLNSYPEFKTGYVVVEENISPESYIQIIGSDGFGVNGASIIVNDSLIYESDLEGKVFLSKEIVVNSIKIGWLQLPENNSYEVKNPKSNVYIVKMTEKDLSKIYFKDKKVKIRKGYLIIDNQKFIKQAAD